ncbi:hypothetical protein E2C01_076599 [Portunus trituberculatus]|uniref:Uncharacterized protein n=1 Tax=Portunus trituberculatus TaxID=210409 RepID=A0A5B7IK56_PORTR|nr:hypothetical protein [Portunus trituberculatus]
MISVPELVKEAAFLGYTKDIQQYVLIQQQELWEDRAKERELERQKLEAEKELREFQERQAKKEDENEEKQRCHEKDMLQLKLARPQQYISSHLAAQIPTHRLHMSKYEKGQAIEPFIERFEMVTTTYKLREAIKTVEFMNLFYGNPFDIIQTRHGYERLRVSYLEQWKDESPRTVEGILDLCLRMQLEKSCPARLVAQLKTQKVKSLQQMSGMADAHFAAYGYREAVA